MPKRNEYGESTAMRLGHSSLPLGATIVSVPALVLLLFGAWLWQFAASKCWIGTADECLFAREGNVIGMIEDWRERNLVKTDVILVVSEDRYQKCLRLCEKIISCTHFGLSAGVPAKTRRPFHYQPDFACDIFRSERQ